MSTPEEAEALARAEVEAYEKFQEDQNSAWENAPHYEIYNPPTED